MSRYTSAYSAFVERLNEINIILRLARQYERRNPIDNAEKINALCRSATVLLCSHIEGYTKELGELTLGRIVENGVCRSKISNLIPLYASRDLVFEIKETSDSEKLAEKIALLFARDLALWEQEGAHPQPISEDRFNKSFSSPSYQKIASYMGRFGYKTFKKDLGKALQSDFNAARNWIDHIVDIRNKIAHGDANTTKTPTDLLDALPVVKNSAAQLTNYSQVGARITFVISDKKRQSFAFIAITDEDRVLRLTDLCGWCSVGPLRAPRVECCASEDCASDSPLRG